MPGTFCFISNSFMRSLSCAFCLCRFTLSCSARRAAAAAALGCSLGILRYLLHAVEGGPQLPSWDRSVLMPCLQHTKVHLSRATLRSSFTAILHEDHNALMSCLQLVPLQAGSGNKDTTSQHPQADAVCKLGQK